MDTSETYIKMCEKAEEIQKGHKWEYGDWLMDVAKSIVIFIPWEQAVEECPDYYRDCIFLPRQDQLQAMVWDSERYRSKAELIGCVYHFVFPMCKYKVIVKDFIVDDEDNPNLVTENVLLNGEGVDYPKQFTSMEQLWLAFVYKEKYNKVWNGTDWVADKVLVGQRERNDRS